MSDFTVCWMIIGILISIQCAESKYSPVGEESMREPFRSIGVILKGLGEETMSVHCTGWLDVFGLLHTNAHCFLPRNVFMTDDAYYLFEAAVSRNKLNIKAAQRAWMQSLNEYAITVLEQTQYTWIPGDRWTMAGKEELEGASGVSAMEESRLVITKDEAEKHGFHFDQIYIPSGWHRLLVKDYGGEIFESMYGKTEEEPLPGPTHLDYHRSKHSAGSIISRSSTGDSITPKSSTPESITRKSSTPESIPRKFFPELQSSASPGDISLKSVHLPSSFPRVPPKEYFKESAQDALQNVIHDDLSHTIVEMDVAMVRLDRDPKSDDYSGFFLHPFDNEMFERTVTTAGFPGDRKGTYVFANALKASVDPVHESQWSPTEPGIWVDLQSGCGASGSPMWFHEKSKVSSYHAFAILSAACSKKRGKTLFVKFQMNAFDFMKQVFDLERKPSINALSETARGIKDPWRSLEDELIHGKRNPDASEPYIYVVRTFMERGKRSRSISERASGKSEGKSGKSKGKPKDKPSLFKKIFKSFGRGGKKPAKANIEYYDAMRVRATVDIGKAKGKPSKFKKMKSGIGKNPAKANVEYYDANIYSDIIGDGYGEYEENMFITLMLAIMDFMILVAMGVLIVIVCLIFVYAVDIHDKTVIKQ